MTPEQCRAARGWLNISQNELSSAAKVSVSTVRDFERGRRLPYVYSLKAIQTALEAKGIIFLDGETSLGIIFTERKSP